MKKEVKWLITMVCTTSSIALSGCSSKSFSVNFQPNYAGCETMDSIAVNAGKKVEQPITPTREGYQFTGWYKDTTLTEEWDFDKDKVKSNNIIGKVILVIPSLGKLQFFLASKKGFVFAIIIPALIIITYDIYKIINAIILKSKLSKLKNKNGNI